MIDFWLKLWQLTRPYKGRFALGILCGLLSGMADTAVLVTVAIVAGAVFPDTNPPVLLGGQSHGLNQIQVAFSKRMAASTATNVANYSLAGANGPVTIAAAAQDASQSNVVLSVSSMTDRASYILTVNNLIDQTARGNALASNSLAGVVASVHQPREVAVSKAPDKMRHWAAKIYLSVQRAAAPCAASRFGKVWLVSLIPLIMLARGLVNYLSSYLMNWVGIRAICDLRARLFEHLLNQPLSFLSRTSTGELMSRLSNDVALLQATIGVYMVTLISQPINIISMISLPLAISWRYTVIALVALPACVIPVAIYNRKVRKSAESIQAEAAGLNRVMHESFTGIRVLKSYNLEKVATDRFRGNQAKFISHSMRVVRATESPGPIIEFAGAVGVAALILSMATQVTLDTFMVFVIALLALYKPIKALVRLQTDLHRSRAATERVFQLLAIEPTLTDPPQPVPLRAAGGDIHFDNVSFAYDHHPVLNGIQLRVQPSEKVALVGKSGSGKTTLANLLLRFYDPTHGAIRIAGVDLRQAAVQDLRRQVAVVTQEVILFNDTIRNNIASGRAGATNAEIEEAARHAFAHDFIMEKPGGYNAVVGEKGVNLSGGQRQRIAIARALLRNAPILLLDEATSSLDNEAERIVQASLDELMKGRTTICIAHRLSTIQKFDRLAVMDAGEIVEMGNHAELLARGGIYAKLYALEAEIP